MKVLLINGSAHQKGNTFHALSMAATTLAAQGIETEIMQIGNKPVRGCIACGQKPGEAENDEEGMQTMRTMANNMAWLLKRIHQGDDPQYPEREAWTPMNFIR